MRLIFNHIVFNLNKFLGVINVKNNKNEYYIPKIYYVYLFIIIYYGYCYTLMYVSMRII